MRKRCSKGKSCGATCIDRVERCVLELGPIISRSITQVRSKLGVVKLYEQVREQKVKGFQGKFNRIRKELKQEVGGQIRASRDVLELKKRLQKEGLLPKSAKSENLGDIFMRGIEAGKREREAQKGPSVPEDLKRQLAALGGPRQLERSPGARTRTPLAVRQDLAGIVSSAKKGDMTLMMDDISRIMRGSLPQNIEIASDRGELGVKGRFKGSATKPGATTGNTRWAREDAGDFDKGFKIYKRIRGDQDSEDWNESVSKGRKLGQGGFGTVMAAGGNKVHKRGEIGENEPEIIKRVGKAGIGPKLLVAELATPKGEEYGIKIHDGRIAMTKVDGKPMGNAKADDKINGKNVADIYWKAMADLHRLGIAHNDAHIDNILIDKSGKGRWVDMGLSQLSPKAALAEALGALPLTLRNVKPQSVMAEDAAGHMNRSVGGAYKPGNWQARRWDATGIKELERMSSIGNRTQFVKNYPVLGKVVDNKSAVQYALLKAGFSRDEIAALQTHGIRSPLSSYNDGPWKKMTDKQAQDLLNMLYDGI